jgi:hypothetical protein
MLGTSPIEIGCTPYNWSYYKVMRIEETYSSKHKEKAMRARLDWKLALPSVGALGNRLPAKDLIVFAVNGVASGLESSWELEEVVGSEDNSSSPSELCAGSLSFMASGPPPEYDKERRSL